MFIYTLPRTPGATKTTPWETFCRSRSPFVVIDHSKFRAINRWQHVERKRKFKVTLFKPSRHAPFLRSEPTWHMTLAGAEAAAAKLVAKETERWSTAQDDGWRGRGPSIKTWRD